jgi:deoxyribonuclease-4
MSIAGGPARAFARGESAGCETMQVFTGAPNRWQVPDLTPEQVADWRRARDAHDIHPVVVHSSYLINLASPDDDLWARSIAALAADLRRCAMLEVRRYVLHPGSHTGSGQEAGLARVAAGLDAVLAQLGDDAPTILLENTAGAGSILGAGFEELAAIMAQARRGAQLGVCFDTAHGLAAGHDFRDAAGYAAMWAAFDAAIGLERLGALHLNDSKRELGSHVDRHEQIGQGHVGLEAFRLLLNDPRLRRVPMILETPKGPDLAEDRENLALLRGLLDPA